MIRNTLIAIMILLCSSMTTIFAKDKINNEWLNTDRVMLSKSNYLLTTDLKSIKDITNYNYYLTNPNEDKALGLNYRIIHLLKPGGYSRINVCALIDHDGNIAMYEVRIFSDELVWNILAKEYKYGAINNIHITESGLSYTHRNNQSFKIFDSGFKTYFGKFNNVEIPEIIKNEYEFLTNPMSEYDYGYICYFAGSKPEARIAIEKIIKYGNTKILENILTSCNPEGRFYAIEALFAGHIDSIKSSNRYSDILDKIARLRVPVTQCSGCIISDEAVSDIESISAIIKQEN